MVLCSMIDSIDVVDGVVAKDGTVRWRDPEHVPKATAAQTLEIASAPLPSEAPQDAPASPVAAPAPGTPSPRSSSGSLRIMAPKSVPISTSKGSPSSRYTGRQFAQS